jgi:hypothetical protein
VRNRFNLKIKTKIEFGVIGFLKYNHPYGKFYFIKPILFQILIKDNSKKVIQLDKTPINIYIFYSTYQNLLLKLASVNFTR